MKKLITFTLLIISLTSFSQEIKFREYTTQKQENANITIDGQFNEPAWQLANWDGDFIQYSPYEGKPPYQQTEFAIIYDKNNIYLAIKALDNNPDSIVTRMTRRDYAEGDILSINLDSYNDKRTAFGFNVSAAGVKTDVTHSDNVTEDNTWDPIWFVKTAFTEEGWNAEIAIPLTQLRFDESENQTWGMQITRYIFRNDEISIWQPMKRDQAAYIANFGKLKGISGIKPKNVLDIIPYAVARLETFEKNPENPFRSEGFKTGFNAGLDAKVGLTNYLTMDLTINPDFGQVEADPSVINLSTYETYYQEKRPFFIEGKNILNYKLDIGDGEWIRDMLFYSRRIGRRPNYEPVLNQDEYNEAPEFTRILGAAKISGKTKNGWSIGLLESVISEENAEIRSINESRTQVVEPMTNYLIGRIQKDFNDGNSYIGGIATAVNRDINDPLLDFLHKSAFSGGVDWMHRWNNQKWRMIGGLYFSRVNGSTNAISLTQKAYIRNFQRPDADYLEYDSTRTSLSGYGGKFDISKIGGKLKFGASLTWKSPGLEINDVGFAQQVDRITESTWINYQIYNPFFIFRTVTLNASEFVLWDFGGNKNMLGVVANGSVQFKNYWNASASFQYNGEQLFSTTMRGGPALKNPAYNTLQMSLLTNPQKKLTFQIFGEGNISLEKDYSKSVSTSLNIGFRPIDALRFDITPGMYLSNNELQYVTQKNYNSDMRYIFARIRQNTLNMSFRIDCSITPDFSIQYWGQPFIATGKYSDYKFIIDSKAKKTYDRFQFYNQQQIGFNNQWNVFTIDDNIDGITDYYINKPDFNVKTFLSNMVLRWEYLPGSTLYLVWSQSRNAYVNNGSFDFTRDIKSLYHQPADNIFLVKLSYRFGR
ncbi:MAG: carbohydrate binding family 9 domain-containing protein [Prolixibacteraceae bacterium]|nr:carbohydrate binding family 9 domain-containing protein [Prolixibacteraceae bacterium]MBN2773598.1 carbohydrate binding family 9 domain-containing protein [Prolixibacteraceae bacterium]